MRTQELLGAQMSWGEAFSLKFVLLPLQARKSPIENIKIVLLIESIRFGSAFNQAKALLQVMIMTCACKSRAALHTSMLQRATILGSESAELNACLLGMARTTQQKLQYALFGPVQVGTASNHFYKQVFLRNGLCPAAEVQKHLGLVHKGFMDM